MQRLPQRCKMRRSCPDTDYQCAVFIDMTAVQRKDAGRYMYIYIYLIYIYIYVYMSTSIYV